MSSFICRVSNVRSCWSFTLQNSLKVGIIAKWLLGQGDLDKQETSRAVLCSVQTMQRCRPSRRKLSPLQIEFKPSSRSRHVKKGERSDTSLKLRLKSPDWSTTLFLLKSTCPCYDTARVTSQFVTSRHANLIEHTRSQPITCASVSWEFFFWLIKHKGR